MVGLVVSIITLRTQQLKGRQKVLEKKIKEATDEVKLQNEELTAAKEKLSGIMNDVRNHLGKASEELLDATNSQAATI